MSLTQVESGNGYSPAVVAGQCVFLAGQVADGLTLETSGQTRQGCARLDRLLGAARSRRDQLTSVTIFVRDIANFAPLNDLGKRGLPTTRSPLARRRRGVLPGSSTRLRRNSLRHSLRDPD
jgi:enamine deaminase RidA (YjgF/YER057c/UK114 family)